MGHCFLDNESLTEPGAHQQAQLACLQTQELYGAGIIAPVPSGFSTAPGI